MGPSWLREWLWLESKTEYNAGDSFKINSDSRKGRRVFKTLPSLKNMPP